jgi:hypothetical protein
MKTAKNCLTITSVEQIVLSIEAILMRWWENSDHSNEGFIETYRVSLDCCVQDRRHQHYTKRTLTNKLALSWIN